MEGGVICGFLSTYETWELRFELNDQLPPDQKFEPLFWSLSNRLQFRQLQKRVLPNSPRPRRAWHFGLAGFFLFFSGVALVTAALR
jgi:hypothetical protein